MTTGSQKRRNTKSKSKDSTPKENKKLGEISTRIAIAVGVTVLLSFILALPVNIKTAINALANTSTPTIIGTPTVTQSLTYTPIFIPIKIDTPVPTNTPSPTNTFISTATALTFVPAYSWYFDATREGWTTSAYITSFGWQSAGYIGGNITGIDPIIYSADMLGVDITNNTVKIMLNNLTASTSAQLFFTTYADGNINEAKSKIFNILPNSGYTEYTLNMYGVPGWAGALRRLRFDPGYSTGYFGIDYIKIGNIYIPSPTPIATALLATP